MLGKALYIGEKVTLRVRDLAERCVMVNLSQADLPDDPRRSVGRDPRPHVGVYAEVLVRGAIKCDYRVLVGN